MITALIVAIIGYALFTGWGFPNEVCLGLASVLFLCTIPFASLFGGLDRRRQQKEREIDALEEISRQARRPRHSVPPQPGTSQKVVFKDDRVVINDNRQVNIYHGEKPKE